MSARRPFFYPATAVLAAALLLAAAAGCGEEAGPVAGGTAATSAGAAAAQQAAAAKAEERKAEEQYFYTPIGKRDPFRPYFMEKAGASVEPTETGTETPLQRFEIEQLRLVAIVTGISTPRAMVEDPQGKGYVMKPGAMVGRHGGRVTEIKRDEVVVEEEYLDVNAKRVINRLHLRLPKEELEDILR